MAYKQLKLWFDKDLAKLLGQKIVSIKPDFNIKKFIKQIDLAVQDLELKDRVEVISDEIHARLGEDYTTNIQLLMQILGPENKEETGMFKNFYWVMPIAKYIEKYGLNDFKISMNAIEEVTKRNTGEYCIRPFIEKYPKKTLKVMTKWSKSKNIHLRRLSSEGGRPRLPWANKLQLFIDDPSPLFPILNQLKDDPSKYVQKSVANCLNDIVKDQPEIAKSLIEDWKDGGGKERKWIIKHSLRNLIKRDDKWALDIIKQIN